MSTVPHQEFPPLVELLRRLDIRLEKRKSQHFLRRQEVCAGIAALAGLTPAHRVIEVGAGLGNLTVELAARAGHVISVEMDHAFDEWHGYLAGAYGPGRIEFLHQDFLKADLERLCEGAPGPVCGVGNLPYQITSDILFRFVDSPFTFERLVFMVQKEVAERIAAGPAARAAGALTYKIALRYTARIALHIGPECFLPPPQVESSVIVLEPLATPLFGSDGERARVYALLDWIFRYRRKTVSNGLLQAGLAPDRAAAAAALAAAGIEPTRRPETLTLAEVLALAGALHG